MEYSIHYTFNIRVDFSQIAGGAFVLQLFSKCYAHKHSVALAFTHLCLKKPGWELHNSQQHLG